MVRRIVESLAREKDVAKLKAGPVANGAQSANADPKRQQLQKIIQKVAARIAELEALNPASRPFCCLERHGVLSIAITAAAC